MADVTEFNLGVSEYGVNDLFFQAIIRNIMLIDMSIAGLDGYNAVNVPMLVDSLIAKTGRENRQAIRERKKEIVKSHLEGIDVRDKDAKDQAIFEANMDALGYVIDHYYRYLNFETKHGVMES